MKILELILRIVLRLIDLLSKPSDAGPSFDQPAPRPNEEKDQSTQYYSNSTSQSEPAKPGTNTSPKDIVVYNEEVNALLNRVIETHRAREEADMNEIMRLRKEISSLQEELILVKASVHSRNKIDAKPLPKDDDPKV